MVRAANRHPETKLALAWANTGGSFIKERRFFALGAGSTALEIREFFAIHPEASKHHIVAFEPAQQAQHDLQRFFVEHGLVAQAEVVPFGAWYDNTTKLQVSSCDAAEKMGFAEQCWCGGLDTCNVSHDLLAALPHEHVPVLDFAEYVWRVCEPHQRNVLWMDIEGAEYKVLPWLFHQGALEACIQELRVVWHAQLGKSLEAQQLLENQLIDLYGLNYAGFNREFPDPMQLITY